MLPSLVPNYKWLQRHRDVNKVGDICLIRMFKGIRSRNRLGRVIKAKPGDYGFVRKVKVQYKLPEETVFRNVDRAIHDIAVTVQVEEQNDKKDDTCPYIVFIITNVLN